jgi:TetR/AcrR family transcriptional regulator
MTIEVTVGQDMKKQPTEEKVFQAALKEFALCGYEGARVDRIARRAKVNKAMIYYHYKNKEHLYEKVLSSIYENMYVHIATIKKEGVEADEQIYSFIENFLCYFDSVDSDFFGIMLRELASGGKYYKKLTIPKLILPILSIITPIFKEAAHKKLIRDVDQFYTLFQTIGGIVFLNMLKVPTQGTKLHDLLYREGYIDVYKDHLIGILRHGIENREQGK